MLMLIDISIIFFFTADKNYMMDLDLTKLSLEAIPIAIVVSLSSIILFLQGTRSCKKSGYQEDTGDVPLGSTRFSTVGRDVIKIIIILLQIGQFGFLFYLRYKHDEGDEGGRILKS